MVNDEVPWTDVQVPRLRDVSPGARAGQRLPRSSHAKGERGNGTACKGSQNRPTEPTSSRVLLQHLTTERSRVKLPTGPSYPKPNGPAESAPGSCPNPPLTGCREACGDNSHRRVANVGAPPGGSVPRLLHPCHQRDTFTPLYMYMRLVQPSRRPNPAQWLAVFRDSQSVLGDKIDLVPAAILTSEESMLDGSPAASILVGRATAAPRRGKASQWTMTNNARVPGFLVSAS